MSAPAAGRLAGNRVLVTGAQGLLGAEFAAAGESAGAEVARISRPALDLDRPDRVRAVMGVRPGNVVIHCAAETDVDACERDPEMAFRRNGACTRAVAEAARDRGAQLVFISSSGVFDGKMRRPYDESDPPSPRTVYARSKVAAEEMLRAEFPEALIVRAGWLFGGEVTQRKNFVAARWREARGRQEVVSASDKTGSPTWTRDLVRQVFGLVTRGASGVVHVVNAEPATRAEYVAEILRLCGLPAVVRPVSSQAFPRSAPVPDNEALTSLRMQEFGLSPLRSWKPALSAYLAERRADFVP